MKLRTLALAALTGILTVSACGGGDNTDPGVGPPAKLVSVSGSGQEATVASALPQPLTAKVTDARDRPVAGVAVTWTATAGTPSSASTTTNAEGVAQVGWTLGTKAGAQSMTAAAAGVASAQYTATAKAGAAAELKVVSGGTQTGAVGTALSQPLVVRAADAHDNAVAGAQVAFSATAGTLSPETAVTDANGRASTTWTLGPVPGQQTATATLGSLTAATFSATAQAGPPVSLALVQQPSDTARNGAVLTRQPIVELRDAAGNAVAQANVLVTASVATGSGTLGSPEALTAADGRANFVGLTLLGTAGEWSLRFADAGGRSTTSAPITLLPGDAVLMTRVAGDNQVAPAGSAVPTPPTVAIADQSGNGVPGVAVEFDLTFGGGTLTGAQATTGADGRAAVGSWTLGEAPGTNALRALSAGLTGSPMNFVATGSGSGSAAATLSGQISATTAFQNAVATRAAGRSIKSSSLGAASAGALPAGKLRTSGRAARDPTSLIVTYRADAVGAPAGGMRAGQPQVAAQVGRALRERLDDAAPALDFEVQGVSPAILSGRVRVTDPARVEDVRRRLLQDPAIAHVELDAIASGHGRDGAIAARAAAAAAPTIPNDFYWPVQAWHYTMVDLPRAWRTTTGSSDVLVAVVDDGIRFAHPALANRLTNDGYDFVSSAAFPVCGGGTVDNAGDGTGYDPDPTQPAAYDWNSSQNCASGTLSTIGNHGMHVAGTIGAAGNDGVGVTGVNWNVRIRPVRVLGVTGRGSFYDIAQGILYAAGLPADNGAGGVVQAPSGARIINLSLGGTSSTSALQSAVVQATQAGALLVVSMGNDGSSTPQYPAAYPEVIAVSAVAPNENLAGYSNYGAHVDIAAPGGDFASGNGQGSFGVASSTWNFQSGEANYAYYQGTSMAAPHVSGVAALLLARQPGLSAAELRARLLDYAVDAGAPGKDDRYGAGILNARNSLTSSLEPPRSLFARLYDAQTGSTLTSVGAASGRYQFDDLVDGTYYVFAGEDEDDDGAIGVPGRRWGAYDGSLAEIRQVIVSGGGNYVASFPIGLPQELEPNNGTGTASRLFANGYAHAALSTTTDVDVYRLALPAGGYVFETSGWAGGCSYALEADTQLRLLSASGAVLATNDNIDANALNYCSRIATTLPAGTYFVEVSGTRAGRYRLEARRTQ